MSDRYEIISLPFTKPEVRKLAKGQGIRLSREQLEEDLQSGGVPVALTMKQIKHIHKAREKGVGVIVRMSVDEVNNSVSLRDHELMGGNIFGDIVSGMTGGSLFGGIMGGVRGLMGGGVRGKGLTAPGMGCKSNKKCYESFIT